MDKDKREIYDEQGEEGLKEGGGRGGADIFEAMFGGGRGRGGPKGPQKGKSVQHAVKVTLEEVYNGKTTKIAVNRDRLKNADGSEIDDSEATKMTCPTCKGRGMVTKMVMLGPGMYS